MVTGAVNMPVGDSDAEQTPAVGSAAWGAVGAADPQPNGHHQK